MCRVGPKLKLCARALPRLLPRRHRWSFFRFEAGKNDLVIGRVVTPDRLGPADEAANRARLLQRLQEPDVFDQDLAPQPGDRLLLTFCFPAARGGDSARLVHYGYEFDGQQWQECEYDDLSWRWRHDRTRAGKIGQALAQSASVSSARSRHG